MSNITLPYNAPAAFTLVCTQWLVVGHGGNKSKVRPQRWDDRDVTTALSKMHDAPLRFRAAERKPGFESGRRHYRIGGTSSLMTWYNRTSPVRLNTYPLQTIDAWWPLHSALTPVSAHIDNVL